MVQARHLIALTLLLVLEKGSRVLGANVENPANPSHGLRAEFSYEAPNGADTWPTTYPTCGGSSQSPINIVTNSTVATSTDPGLIMVGGYDSAMMGKVTNNDHTVQFQYTAGIQPYIHGGRLPPGDRFEFAQLHWHWGSVSSQGSEHTVDGKEYPAEIHLVHYNTKYGDISTAVQKADGLAVLGFFYEISSADNGNLDALLTAADKVKTLQRKQNKRKGRATTTATVDSSIRLDQLIPVNRDEYYYYSGSLTTPTCDEVVLWTVFTTPVQISESQMNRLRAVLDSNNKPIVDNYRPVQPLNGRTVYKRSNTALTTTDTVARQAELAYAYLSSAIIASVVTAVIYIALFVGISNNNNRSLKESSSNLIPPLFELK